jgi:hypothetical protein
MAAHARSDFSHTGLIDGRVAEDVEGYSLAIIVRRRVLRQPGAIRQKDAPGPCWRSALGCGQRLVGGIGLSKVRRQVDLARFLRCLVEISLHFVCTVAFDRLVFEIVGFPVVRSRHLATQISQLVGVVHLFADGGGRLFQRVFLVRPLLHVRAMTAVKATRTIVVSSAACRA